MSLVELLYFQVTGNVYRHLEKGDEDHEYDEIPLDEFQFPEHVVRRLLMILNHLNLSSLQPHTYHLNQQHQNYGRDLLINARKAGHALQLGQIIVMFLPGFVLTENIGVF